MSPHIESRKADFPFPITDSELPPTVFEIQQIGYTFQQPVTEDDQNQILLTKRI